MKDKYYLEAPHDGPDKPVERRLVNYYKTLPRVGEWIELTNGDVVTVKAVIHRPTGEIIVRAT